MNDNPFQNLRDSFYQDADFFESAMLNLQVESLTIKEIIHLYYQAINLMSVVEFFKRQDCELPQDLLKRISEIETMVHNEFNYNTHPKILQYLSDLIVSNTAKLQFQHPSQTKDDLEKTAHEYNKLRELMSTKEFVVQYDRGLKNG